jgi:hypothetical protein
MDAAEESILESTRQIYRLYHDGFDVWEASDLLRDRDISDEMVKSIYDQLSRNAEKLTTGKFHYYTIGRGKNRLYSHVNYWTNRYLVAYRYDQSSDPAFNGITVFDVFNDKSM